MAKVTGPLMSMDASGSYAGTIVFTKWKGRNVVRQLVTPANPNSADQEAARNKMRVAAAGQKWANITTLKLDAETATDRERIRAITPSGYAWNGYLVESMIGKGSVTYTAAATAYAALTAPQKTAWGTAAGALTPPIPAVAQTEAGGGQTTPLAAGEVFFIYYYALYSLGLADAPTGTPPTYA